MKSKVISVLILSTTLILVSLILVSSFGLSKRNPGSELITFTGDLKGSKEVVGCCPNAGPNPEYTMELSNEFPQGFPGIHEGYIFMNGMGGKLPWAYKVVFWWTEDGTEYSIEIRGGEAHKDKRTKILKVTFENVPSYEIWIGYERIYDPVYVTFNLTRDPHHPAKG